MRIVLLILPIVSFCLLLCVPALAQDWNARVHACVSRKDLECARTEVDSQLRQSPTDLEALIWRARLLSWSVKWAEAEEQYRAVIATAPRNADALLGLADVQTWREEWNASLQTLDAAASAGAPAAEVLSRRARVLVAQGRNREGVEAYRELLAIDPGDSDAKHALAALLPTISRHFLRIGSNTDRFSYTSAANLESANLTSQWTDHWTTTIGADFYQRFGQDAEVGEGSVTYRFRSRNWITGGGAIGNHQDVAAQYITAFGYGHGWRMSNHVFRGLELNIRQQELWFSSSRVTMIAADATVYLPSEWTLTVRSGGVRTHFTESEIAWAPAGFARLSFPIVRRLSANLLYGVGAETFPTADQIGRFSAHTYGGGVKLRLTEMQELGCDIATQQRTQHISQFSVGVGYGVRF